METSLYLLLFDAEPDTLSITQKLENFGATCIDRGEVVNSIEFELPNSFDAECSEWEFFLADSGCILERSALPT